jgi:hypothetical protein
VRAGIGGGSTAFLSVVLVVLGLAVIARTASLGGGIGYVLGSVLTLAGGLRLYFLVR